MLHLESIQGPGDRSVLHVLGSSHARSPLLLGCGSPPKGTTVVQLAAVGIFMPLSPGLFNTAKREEIIELLKEIRDKFKE
jgi:hypothetical protein